MSAFRRPGWWRTPIRLGGAALAVAATAAVVFGSAAMAGPENSQRPVCPGPATFDSARCHAHVDTDRSGRPDASTSPTGMTATQLRTAYSLGANASTQTIAIVDAYDLPTAQSDLSVYST